MKSFIGWIGGKSRLKNQIISLIPTDCSRYIEVCDRINLEHLDRICEVLDCNVSDILEYRPNRIKKTGKNLIIEENGNRKAQK